LPKRVRVACEDRATLLVLDNFEHVLDAAPVVADLLTSVVSLRLMVTSRAPLRVRGEREYAVGPLALETGADVWSPADLARSPAVRLLWNVFATCNRTFGSLLSQLRRPNGLVPATVAKLSQNANCQHESGCTLSEGQIP